MVNLEIENRDTVFFVIWLVRGLEIFGDAFSLLELGVGGDLTGC